MEHLEGLPGHVVPVRYGEAKDGEFVFHDRIRSFEHGCPPHGLKPGGSVFEGRIIGPADSSCRLHGLIVRPEDGYDFVYDIANDQYVVVKRFDQPNMVKAVYHSIEES